LAFAIRRGAGRREGRGRPDPRYRTSDMTPAIRWVVGSWARRVSGRWPGARPGRAGSGLGRWPLAAV